MERNVMSFGVAISKGYEPRLYTYDDALIPLGEFDAIIDFKAWSKRIIAINCYFTQTGTGKKFAVTVYCNNAIGRYEFPGSTVNFADSALGIPYHIKVNKGNKGRIKWLEAEAVS